MLIESFFNIIFCISLFVKRFFFFGFGGFFIKFLLFLERERVVVGRLFVIRFIYRICMGKRVIGKFNIEVKSIINILLIL